MAMVEKAHEESSLQKNACKDLCQWSVTEEQIPLLTDNW